ncbi:MAG: hypothetical protein QF412_13010, partial [Planctomycetota bacterium]|nr:hypothetical protein [Planctomycetota bacterium]
AIEATVARAATVMIAARAGTVATVARAETVVRAAMEATEVHAVIAKIVLLVRRESTIVSKTRGMCSGTEERVSTVRKARRSHDLPGCLA